MLFQDDEEIKEAAASDGSICNPVYDAGPERTGSTLVSQRRSSSQLKV